MTVLPYFFETFMHSAPFTCRPLDRFVILILFVFMLAANQQTVDAQTHATTRLTDVKTTDVKAAWKPLFDSRSLAGWKKTNFGGEGSIEVRDNVICMDFGHPLTGISYTGPVSLPKIDYEIELEARRVSGSDFFCGLTFPYKDSHCTLILGGWGGQLVGLSSFDNKDASENETTDYIDFKNGKWHRILLVVQDNKIEAKLNGKQIVVCKIGDRNVHTRPEVELSRPLGIAAYQTQSELRKIRVRKRSSD